MVLCVWFLFFIIMFSKVIHVACVRTLFLLPNNIPLQENTTFCLPIHQLMDIWVVYTLVIMNNTLTNSCVKVFV